MAIIIAGGSFYGGMKYGQRQKLTGRANGNGAMMPGAGGFGQMGSGTQKSGSMRNVNFINGEIIAKDDKSFTVKTKDGGSKILFYSSSTQFKKMADGVISDLAVGAQIMANGTPNSDGSVTAQMIQLQPNAPAVSPGSQPVGN